MGVDPHWRRQPFALWERVLLFFHPPFYAWIDEDGIVYTYKVMMGKVYHIESREITCRERRKKSS